MSLPWFEGSYAEIAARVNAGAGSPAGFDAAESWRRARAILVDCDATITQSYANAGVGWSGPAFESFRAAMEPVSTWVQGATVDASNTVIAVDLQGSHADEFKRLLPPPPPVIRFTDTAHNPAAVAATEDARRLARDYANTTAGHRRELNIWSQPPALAVDVPPPGTGGGTPVGRRAATVVGPAGTSTVTSAGRSGGSGLGTASAGADPQATDQAGAAAGGAAVPRAGSGSDAGAPGAVAVPRNVPPGGGATTAARDGAGSPPVASASLPSTGDDGSAVGAADPAGLPPSTGRRGAADGPGPAVRLPIADGVAPFAPGPGGTGAGQGVPPERARLGGGPRLAPGFGGVEALPPGSGGRGSRPPDPGWSVPGREPASRAPSWRDVVAAEPATSGPARAGSTAAAERAGMYPPMIGAGAGAGQGGARRRPDFLVDDSGAFVDDRWFPGPVIGPEE